MFKFKRLISVFLATILVSSLLCIPSFAQSINSENQFLDNNIKMAYIPSVNETGSNLLNYSFDQGKYDIDVNILTTAGYNNIGQLNLAGIYLGKEFNVTAEYIGKNENGNICVFTGTDIKGIYDVAYCAIEKNISKSILYFTNMANQSDTVLKLYLRDKNNNSFILIEIFDVPFPNTNQRAVISDNEVNAALCWVERTFKPTAINEIENEVSTFAANSNASKTITYTFKSLGYTVVDAADIEMFWDFRDFVRGGSAAGNAGISLVRRYRTCEDAPNNNSSTYSCLYLRDIEYELHTGKNTAVMTEVCEGTVTKGASVTVTSPSASFSISIAGLSASLGSSLSFSFGGTHSANTATKIHDNSDGNYARAVRTALDTNCSLKTANDYFNVSYTIGEYGEVAGAANPTLFWNYFVENELFPYDGYQSSYQKDMTQFIR